MVILEGDGFDDAAAGVGEHGGEAFGSGDAAEGERTETGAEDTAEKAWLSGDVVGEAEAAADDPDGDAIAEQVGDAGADCGLFFSAEDDGTGATEGADGFAAVSGGKERVVKVFFSDEDDVEGAAKLAVLETVVEDVDGVGLAVPGLAGTAFGTGF